MTDEQYAALSEIEKKNLADREGWKLCWILDMLSAGLAVRHAGLIWFLPLCHDYCDEGI